MNKNALANRQSVFFFLSKKKQTLVFLIPGLVNVTPILRR